MFLVCAMLLLAPPLSALDYYDEGLKLGEAQQKSKSATQNEKEHLKKMLAEIKPTNKTYEEKGRNLSETHQNKLKCSLSAGLTSDPQTSLYVFVSFSLPDETWLTLSKELEKVGGIFILRGLPENSFKNLALKVQALRKKGLKIPLQVDPRLFTKFDVQAIPTFVINEEEKFDKLSGNVSLAFALEKMSLRGETENAKKLRKRL